MKIGTARIEARTVIWAAGVGASPAGHWIGAKCDRVGRIEVDPNLAVPGHPEIFAIGDTALAFDANGKPLPGIAPVAKQQGRYVGSLIKARLHGAERVEPFHYRDYGNLATIGRKAAVVDFGSIHLRGLVAWGIWTVAHIYFFDRFPQPDHCRTQLVVGLFHVSAWRTPYHRPAPLTLGFHPAHFQFGHWCQF